MFALYFVIIMFDQVKTNSVGFRLFNSIDALF